MLKGLNHLTLSVANLERSIAFYRDWLGMRLSAAWSSGAYLQAGDLWLCLMLVRESDAVPATGYTHYAFSVDASHFDSCVAGLREHGAIEWQPNRSEGESFYLLDPDGHRLELHVGDLATRLEHCCRHPYAGMHIHD